MKRFTEVSAKSPVDEAFARKLREILADESAMEKITQIAGSISSKASHAPSEPDLPKALPLPRASDSKAVFLESLKPLIRQDKRSKIDKLETALLIAEMFGKRK